MGTYKITLAICQQMNFENRYICPRYGQKSTVVFLKQRTNVDCYNTTAYVLTAETAHVSK